jgi:hypothetical protein
MTNASCFKIKCVSIFLTSLAAISFLWLGCGKKGPPRVPQQPLPATVKDLSYRIDHDRVQLSWTIPAADDRSASYPAAVKLFRFKQSAEESNCEKCPIRFREIADLPVQLKPKDKSRPNTMSYTEVLQRGYRYIYKVVIYNKEGIGGKDSNTVEFLF